MCTHTKYTQIHTCKCAIQALHADGNVLHSFSFTKFTLVATCRKMFNVRCRETKAKTMSLQILDHMSMMLPVYLITPLSVSHRLSSFF